MCLDVKNQKLWAVSVVAQATSVVSVEENKSWTFDKYFIPYLFIFLSLQNMSPESPIGVQKRFRVGNLAIRRYQNSLLHRTEHKDTKRQRYATTPV